MMQSNFQLALALSRGHFAVAASEAANLQAMAERIMAGEGLAQLSTEEAAAPDKRTPAQLMVASATTYFVMSSWLDLDEVPAGSVAVIPMRGIIMKYGFCGGGSMQRAAQILEAGQHPNVAGLLIDGDTPGGQANGLNTVHDAILTVRNDYKKPVIGLVNDGMVASAGVHTFSACTEIWATHTTCQIGSVGALCMLNFSAADPNSRVIYATKSTRKNNAHRLAAAGDDSAIVADLDHLNEDFHARILAQRGDRMSPDSEVFEGDMYNAEAAIEEGLLDRIGSMPEALARVTELAAAQHQTTIDATLDFEMVASSTTTTPNDPQLNILPPTTTMSKYAAICAALGFTSLETNAEGAHFNLEGLDQLDAALVQAGLDRQALATANTNLATVNTALATANTNLTTANTNLATAQGNITSLEQRLAKNPAGDNPRTEGDASLEEQKPLQDWEKLDAEMLQELNAGRAKMGHSPIK